MYICICIYGVPYVVHMYTTYWRTLCCLCIVPVKFPRWGSSVPPGYPFEILSIPAWTPNP